MEGRRRSETGMTYNQPALQVVGFHVEGSTPSPGPHSSTLNDYDNRTSGSPTPVLIPPAFQNNPKDGAISRSQSQRERSVSGLTSSIGMQGPETVVPPPPPLLASLSFGQSAAVAASWLLDAAATTAPATLQPSQESPVTPPAPSAAANSKPESAVPSPEAGPSAPRGGPDRQPPSEDGPGPKSQKEMTKAERRAKQESERAAKAAAREQQGGAGGGKQGKSGTAAAAAEGKAPARPPAASTQAAARPSLARVSAEAADAGRTGRQGSDTRKGAEKPKGKGMSVKSTELFAHLQQYKALTIDSLLRSRDVSSIHPVILKIGLQYASGAVRGGNARCTALLHAVCQVIQDYSTPESKLFSRDLTAVLNTQINFLVECRPLSVSMGNAIKFLKLSISKIDPSTTEQVAKKELIEQIRSYINEKIVVADEQLVKFAVSKVYDGDVVLTYAHSLVVLQVLLEAQQQGRRFQVVVVDSRPECEGRQLLKKLLDAGITCTYISVNGLSYIMRQVTKVFLGASAVLSNGTVMSRAGTAAVAMMAHAYSVPVMICCETYKFHERVQLDSITNNELGDPDALAASDGLHDVADLKDWQEQPWLGMLNLKYDAMPAEYVTMIITEFGMIPPTSVLVILREYRQES